MLLSGFGGDSPIKFPLRKNVRNTKEIISNVEVWTGAGMGKTEMSGYGEYPKARVRRRGDLVRRRIDQKGWGISTLGLDQAEFGLFAWGFLKTL